jgi:hypothetical protein
VVDSEIIKEERATEPSQRRFAGETPRRGVRIAVDEPYCRLDIVTNNGRFRAKAKTDAMSDVKAHCRPAALAICR